MYLIFRDAGDLLKIEKSRASYGQILSTSSLWVIKLIFSTHLKLNASPFENTDIRFLIALKQYIISRWTFHCI